MKIGIVTLPLQGNYGGYLQNWALQRVLIRLGHQPITLDYVSSCSLRWWFRYNIKSILLLPFRSRRRPLMISTKRKRNRIFEVFVKNNLTVTKSFLRYGGQIISEYQLEALVVGSDQVWRPAYASSALEDMYLKFAEGIGNLPKIAYAASFGSSSWEYTPEQTKACRMLVKHFNAVSVREDAALPLCKEHLGINAVRVLDPTLLLTSKDYFDLCKDVKPSCKKFLLAYVLDGSDSDEKKTQFKSEAEKRGLEIKVITGSRQDRLSPIEWVAAFRDASFVITDSFHGTIMAIIFHKEFLCLGNDRRGGSRFASILNLNDKMLDEMRQNSIDFLTSNLR